MELAANVWVLQGIGLVHGGLTEARSALPFRETLLLQTGNGFRAQFLPGGPNRHQLRAIRAAGRSFVGAYSRVHVCSSHCLLLTRPARSTHTTNRLNPIQSMNPGHPAHHRCGIDRARRQQLSWSRVPVRDPASASRTTGLGHCEAPPAVSGAHHHTLEYCRPALATPPLWNLQPTAHGAGGL